MATSMCSQDGILIRVMAVEDYKSLKTFTGNHFYNEEPLCASADQDLWKIGETKINEFHVSMIEQGTCLLALDENNGGSIVGFVLAGALYPTDMEQRHKEAANTSSKTRRRITMLLIKIELEANLFERYGVNKFLYSHFTYVSASMRGKGLGTRLAAALMEIGRAKDFPLMVAYCSSFYSARQKQAMGMECVHSVAYADYKVDGQVVFKPPAPHTHLRVMVIKL